MNHKIGAVLIDVQSVARDIKVVYMPKPVQWFDDLRKALQVCTDTILGLNQSQPAEGWKLPAIAMLYNEKQEILGAFVPSFKETWCAHHDNIDAIYIPNNVYSDFLARIQSAINAWDVHYFDRLQLTEPSLMATKGDDGCPIIFEHYGATRFNAEQVHVKTCENLKPTGFWACQQFDDNNWQTFRRGHIWHSNRIEFVVHDAAQILSIDSLQDIQYLQKNYPIEWSAPVEPWYPEGFYNYHQLPRVMIDWEKVSQDYDGIWYNYNALGNAFGPFDMNSIVIFNPDAIETIQPPDVIRFPAADDADIIQMLSEDMMYDVSEYCEKLQIIADIMLSRIEPGDSDREAFYAELYDAATQSCKDLDNGVFPLIEKWDYIAYLNDLSDAVRDGPMQDER